MGELTQNQAMIRKPILMPQSMIQKVDRIAKRKKVSFAEVVREAVDGFGGEGTKEEQLILEALADTMIESTQELVKRIKVIEEKLDNTHALLETE